MYRKLRFAFHWLKLARGGLPRSTQTGSGLTIDGTAITDLSCPWAQRYANLGTMNVPDVSLNTGGNQLVVAVLANAEEVATIAYEPLD